MISKTFVIDGKTFDACAVSLEPAPFLLIRTENKSFLACGFLDIAAADGLCACAAKVKGVRTFDDMMATNVVAVTKAAEQKGVKIGMTGKEALLKM